MSLKDAAQYLAAHGRGADTTLMHVAPDEVARLQRAAQERGGSLTINPHTGLPEAFKLSDLNPVRILKGEGSIGGSGLAPLLEAAALNYFAPGFGEALGLTGAEGLGLSNAAATGAVVGGANALASGSLQKGLMAGLSAYGGTALGEAAMGGIDSAKTMAANEAAASKLGADANAQDILMYRNASPVVPEMSIADKIKAGAKGIAALGPKDLIFKGLAAAAPVLASQSNKNKDDMPSLGSSTPGGYIRQYYYDPKSHSAKPLEPVRTQDWGNTTFESRVPYIPSSARGGLQTSYAMGGITDDGMAGGGPMMGSSSAFDFQQHSEPVVRMADGGTPPQTVEDLYTSILGRPSDAGGAEYWKQQFGDTIDPDEINTFRQAANVELANRPAGTGSTPAGKGGLDYQTLVSSLQNSPLTAAQRANSSPYYQATVDYTSPTVSDDMVQKAYQEVWGRAAAPWEVEAWQGVAGDATQTALSNAPIQAQVADMYRNVLGRDPDPGGLKYWTDRISEYTPVMLSAGKIPDQVYKDFLGAARENQEIVTADQNKNAIYGEAVRPYTGYRSTDQNNNADEWVRNVLGREVTDADRQQQWYKDAASGVANNVNDIGKIYGQFKNYASSVSADTLAQKVAQARQTLATNGLTDADVYARTGKTIEELVGKPRTDLDLMHASQLIAPSKSFDFGSLRGGVSTTGGGRTTDTYTGGTTTTPTTYRPEGATNPYGNYINPGDITINRDGSRTVTPNIPGRPYGGFTGIGQVRDAYTAGGGKLGQVLTPSKAYENTGASADVYKYLMGQGNYPTQETGIGKNSRYYWGVEPTTSNPGNKYRINSQTHLIEPNPDYVAPAANGGLMQTYASGGTTSQDASSNKDNKTATDIVEIPASQGHYEFDQKTGEVKWVSTPTKGTGDVTGKTQENINKFFDNMTPQQKAEHEAQLQNISELMTPMALKMLYDVLPALKPKDPNEPPAPVVDMSTFSPAALAEMGGFDGTMGEPAGTVTVGALSPAEGDANGAASIGDSVGTVGGIGSVGGNAGIGMGATASGIGTGIGGLGGMGGGLAHGGLSSAYNLGSYSDGGRLLRGPGDGVSDSIPATIGKGQPARLADGEFVIPARIVSEIGNGSTEAGARKLYAMMDRVQAARRQTVGKGKVAKNTKADKYLPR